MANLVSYRRTSGDHAESTSLESQKAKIEAKCLIDDHLIVADFVDKASAETAEKREGFQAALDCIYSGAADGLIVWKLDRFARSVRDGVVILGEFKKRGKSLVCVADPIDTTSALGEAFFQIAMVFAELERKTIAERCLNGRDARAAQLRYAGGAAPYGWKAGKDGVVKTLIECYEEQLVIEMIRSFRESIPKMSYRSIAAELTARGIKPPRPARQTRPNAGWNDCTVRSIYVKERKLANWLLSGQAYDYIQQGQQELSHCD